MNGRPEGRGRRSHRRYLWFDTPGDVWGNTVGWTTEFTPDATAVRVIGGALAPSQSVAFSVEVVTEGATFGDIYVNRAQAVASRTGLVIRTSDLFRIAPAKAVVVKKYVQDVDGEWRDAQTIDDYPGWTSGSDLRYRLVVTNIGDLPLTGVHLTDDQTDLAALDPLPVGLGPGAVIDELLPGEANAVTIEYTIPLRGVATGGTLINNACVAVPDDADVPEACDPAGVVVVPSSQSWSKVAAGTDERLAGSEWELTPVDGAGNPTGPAVVVVDCVAETADDCTDADQDPRVGEFLVEGLSAGRYALVETRAPAGYVLDGTPRLLDVEGDTSLPEPIENSQQDPLTIPLTGGSSQQVFMLSAAGLGALTLALIAGRSWLRPRESRLVRGAP